MRFTITIDLGNAAMQSFDDIHGGVLGAIDRAGNDYGWETEPMSGAGGYIFDSNGNRVGKWSAEDDASAEDTRRIMDERAATREDGNR